MFKMQKLNVVRMVETEEQKAQLKAQGFEEVAEVEPNYNDYTLIDLKQIAKDKGIDGYSSMKKEDLIVALKTLNNKESEEK